MSIHYLVKCKCPETTDNLKQIYRLTINFNLIYNKNEAPNILAALSRDKIDQEYSQCVQIYTDASKDSSGKVGICCYIRSFALALDIEMQARLSDDVAVQTEEMVAIKMALENVCQLEQTTTHQRYAIFTDSLSTIDNLASSRSRCRPNLLSDVIDLLLNINSQITVVCVPSHIGTTGNERADQLANMGSKRPHIDIDVGVELASTVELTLTSTSCGNRHMEQRDNWTTLLQRPAKCRQPRSNTFRDEIGRSPRAPTTTRKMQTQLVPAQDSAARHRHLRQLWRSRNHRALSHQLLADEIAAAVKNICDQRKISFTLPTILSQVVVLEELRRLTHRQL